MKITVLGSGTVTPRLRRNASGLLVEAVGRRILVDMGPGTIRRLCEADIDVRTIDAIFITHFHPDHVSDLVPFLFASNYGFGPVREERFYLVGPEGLEQFYGGLVAVYQDWIIPKGDRLERMEVGADTREEFSVYGITCESAPSRHHYPSVSYRIVAEGKSVVISGDTDVSDNLVRLAEAADVLICECSLPDGRKVPGHLVPSEAGRIARDAGAATLVLTHFYPPCDDVDVIAQAAAEYDGKVLRAEDLMVIEP